MPFEKSSKFVNVDELLPAISLSDAARYYGVELPTIHQVGSEARVRCFLLCGKAQETGDRALAIQTDHPAKQWKCHQYGCGKGGNLVSLCDLLKPGHNAGGRPRGERFKEIAKDLQRIASGDLPEGTHVPASVPAAAPPPPETNVPLSQLSNERARGLTKLDEKFVVEV